MLKVLLCSGYGAFRLNQRHWREVLKAHLPEGYEVRLLDESRSLKEQVQDIDVMIVGWAKITKEIIDAAPNLRLIQQHGRGIEGVDVERATKRGVYVAYVPGINAVSVAEHVLCLMFALSKRLRKAEEAFKAGKVGSPPTIELYGKTLGIIGLGATGRELAKRAPLLGMRVIANKKRRDPRLVQELGLDFLGGPEDLDVILREADYVSIHVPLTPETRGMIGQREFGIMKRTAYLINVARGPIVDKEALYEALTRGRIAGAAIDVFWSYPPNPDDPLFTLENLIVTPHLAGFSAEAFNEVGRVMAEDIQRVARGEPPLNLANLELVRR